MTKRKHHRRRHVKVGGRKFLLIPVPARKHHKRSTRRTRKHKRRK